MEGPILIDNTSLASGAAYKVTNYVLSSQYWHKIIVSNANTEPRDLVLTTIMAAVRPHDFIPVNYKVEDDGTVTFLMKNCGQAIMQLYSMCLTVPHPDYKKNCSPFKIKVIICEKSASQFSLCMKSIIVKILRRRYNSSKKTLNLDQFHQDPELTQFFHLSQPKLLYFVLHLGRDLKIERLKLSNNSIESLNPFKAMCNEKFLKGLCNVDLSNNKIATIEELNYLKIFPINSLNLDGNPICNNYNEQGYIKAVLRHFPNLCKLDDCYINKLGLLPFRRNFMCSQSGHEVVDRFLEHYFNLYDSPDRNLLEILYHRNATFSLSQQFSADKNSSRTTNIMSYKKFSRNIKVLTDFSKSDLLMFVGNQMISNVLTALPPTEHDPNTFTVDLTKFEGSLLALTITGVYKHLVTSLKKDTEMYNFMRTFLLIRINEEEYKIINDMMNVTNVTTLNESIAFKSERKRIVNYIHIPVPKDGKEQKEISEGFMLLTKLKKEWANKCLMECEFDLKKSLNLFVSLYKEDKLPQHAFSLEDEKQNETFPIDSALNTVTNIPSLLSPISSSETNSNMDVRQQLTISSQSGKSRNRGVSASVAREKVNGTESTDDIVKKIALMENCTPEETKSVLLNAAKSVITNNKDPWYYSLVGIKFYKSNLLEEARNFLAQGEAVLSKDKYKKIQEDFLLFEIEYGDPHYADDILTKKILSESAEPVLEFVLERVLKINRNLTGGLLWRMAHYKVLLPDIKKILAANKKFILLYGTSEDLTRIIKLEEDYLDPSQKSDGSLRARSPIRALRRSRSLNRTSRSSRSPNRISRRSPNRRCSRSPIGTLRRSRSPNRASRRSRSPNRTLRRSPNCTLKRSRSAKRGSPFRTVKRSRSRSPHRTSRRSNSKSPQLSVSKNKRRSRSLQKATDVANKAAQLAPPSIITENAKIIADVKPIQSTVSNNNTTMIPTPIEFKKFCLEIIKPIGVYLDPTNDPELKKIENFTGSNTMLINMCENLLKHYKNSFSALNVIYKKYWERNMVSSIRDVLARAKDFPDKGLVNNLIVLFKIRMQLQQRNQSETLQKIHLHINKIPFKDVINFFVSLSKESGPHVQEIFESCLENENITESLKRIIVLKYKDVCRGTGHFHKFRINNKLFGFYNGAFNHKLFNYDKLLNQIVNAGDPFIFTKYTPGPDAYIAARNFISPKCTVYKCMRVIKYLFEKDFHAQALAILKYGSQVFQQKSTQELQQEGIDFRTFQISLITAILTANHSKKPKLNPLRKWKPQFELNANLVCSIAEVHLIHKKVAKASDELMNYIINPIILDCDVQKCLYECFESWKRKYHVDMLQLLLQKSLLQNLDPNFLLNLLNTVVNTNIQDNVFVISSDDEEEKKDKP